jgi:hypothetical protein
VSRRRLVTLEQSGCNSILPTVSGDLKDEGSGGHAARSLTLELQAFTWEALGEECAKLGMSIEELVSFSVLYYLADRDSGRIARRLPAREKSSQSSPFGNLLGN